MRHVRALALVLALGACASDSGVVRGSSSATDASAGGLPSATAVTVVDVTTTAVPPATTTTLPPPTTVTEPSTTASPYPLAAGSTGPEVAALQTALATSGYDTGPSDGVFGALTERAVRAFQLEYGLADTGSVDAPQHARIADLAAGAPACDESQLRPDGMATTNDLSWDDPVCAPGWAIRTAYPELGAGVAYLFRVRGSAWTVVNEMQIDFRATIALAENTPLSISSFSRMFGSEGWPGRVASADDVAHYVFVRVFEVSPTGRGFYELLSMWLDGESRSVWDDRLWLGGGTVAEVRPCEPATGSQMEGPYWSCTAVLEGGDTLVLAVDEALTKAVLQEG